VISVEVENLALENVFVPAPYHPLRVLGGAARRMVYSPEGTFLATSDVTEGEPALVPGLSYTVEAALPAPTGADLDEIDASVYDDESYAPWTALPEDYPELAAVNAAIRDEADASAPFEMAFALQSFFRDPDRFTYSTDVEPLRGSDGLTRFVTDDRVGFCTYYATAMAVMLRLEGIPARVAVGFRLGERLESGEYLVTSDHAHAWVEALFPGYGWITFEPTPALPDTLVPSMSEKLPVEITPPHV
jgi:transglutaminase-like putative cysteine protease